MQHLKTTARFDLEIILSINSSSGKWPSKRLVANASESTKGIELWIVDKLFFPAVDPHQPACNDLNGDLSKKARHDAFIDRVDDRDIHRPCLPAEDGLRQMPILVFIATAH